MNLGYACINHGLSTLPKSKRVTTNRSMIKKTFKERGTTYASEITLQNVTDLLTILQWNVDNDIRFFRMSSDIFPWASEYDLEQLPDFNAIADTLRRCGDFATQHGIRLTTHPGPYNKLCSSDERIINNTVKDLNHHAEVMDLMGLSATPYNKINIHVGATYGDKPAAGEVFCRNFDRLSDTCKQRRQSRTMTRHQCGLLVTCMTWYTATSRFLSYLTTITISFALVARQSKRL